MTNTSTSLSMYQKGAVHLLLPIVVLVVAGAFVGSNIQTSAKFPDDANVQGVLVAKSESGGSGSNRGNSEEHKNSENSGRGNQDNATTVKENVNRGPSENSNQGRKEKIEREGIVVSETEIEDEEEDEDEATESGEESELVQELRAISKFPLRIDTSTNQLIMTKNGVERVLTVLPAHAVQNMLRAHLKKGLGPKFFGVLESSPSASPSPAASPSEPPESTESATLTILESEIELEERNDQPVYKIKALKHHKLFGFIPVTTQLTGFVSAENGSLLEETQSLLARIIDLLSP